MTKNLNKKIEIYNGLFSDLVSELSQMYPDDISLLNAKVGLSTLLLVSPSYFCNTAIEYLEPFEDHILNKNEDFFISPDFADILLGDSEDASSSFIKNEVNRIKVIWKDPNTSDNTKEQIWNYFRKITLLGKLIKKNK